MPLYLLYSHFAARHSEVVTSIGLSNTPSPDPPNTPGIDLHQCRSRSLFRNCSPLLCGVQLCSCNPASGILVGIKDACNHSPSRRPDKRTGNAAWKVLVARSSVTRQWLSRK